MAELKQAIDKILEDRSQMKAIVNEEKSSISQLISLLGKLKSSINETGDSELMSESGTIDNALKQLDEAKKQADIISERFNRNTINIGVAGNTHAGKSTLLQSLSGLDDDQIPKAPAQYNLSSTTAVRSEIFNCKPEEARAIIYFRDDAEFVKFINDYLEVLPNAPSVTSKEDFKNYDFSRFSNLNNSQIYSKDRLENLKKSYDSYAKLIGTGTLPIDKSRFNELKQYVSYLYDGKDQYYPAVKAVEIFCNFGNLDDDVQLGLIDLPGFGENKNVDQIMLHGLQTKVDHAIQIFRPADGAEGIQQKDSEKYDQIRSAVQEIDSFKDYLSFFININKSQPNIDSLVSQTENKIKQQLNKSYQHPIYQSSANDRKEVKDPFLKIVQKLVSTLPTMDKEAYSSYRKNVKLEGVKGIVENLSSKLGQKAGKSGQTRDYNSQARRLRTNISYEIDQVQKTYNSQSFEKFKSKADETHKKLSEEIEKLCFEPKDGFTDWESWAQRQYPASRGYGLYDDELHRLWAKLIYEYSEDMNRSYKEELDLLKTAIMKGIKANTGNLLQTTDISELITLLQNKNNLFKAIPDAFVWLNKIVLDFKHSMFSIIQEKKIRDFMDPRISKFDDKTQNKSSVATGLATETIVPEIKKQLINNFKKTNDEILKIVKENEKTNYALLAISEMFSDILIRFDDKDSEWATLFEQFGDKINQTEDAVNWENIYNLSLDANKIIQKLNR